MCTMSYVIVYVNGGPLKRGRMPPPAPPPKRNPDNHQQGLQLQLYEHVHTSPVAA